MAKDKVESEKNVEFAEGGHDNHMFGEGDRTTVAGSDAAGEQQPGGTAHKTSGGKQKFASGGSGRMFGYSPSVPATAGQTGAR